jgi:hypothetical protein
LRTLTKLLIPALPLLLTGIASASLLPIGYISYDVNIPASTASFDITNLTGPNALPPDFPVATSVDLSSLSLKVDFSDGSTQTFGSPYFTLSSDGLSFNGGAIPIGGANPQPTDATLTGMFSPTTLTLSDSSMVTIDSSFSAMILPSSPPNLGDGDFAVIYASPAGTTSPVPEPGSVLLLATTVGMIVVSRRPRVRGMLRKVGGVVRTGAVPMVLILACALLIPAAHAQVNLATATSPSTGVAGVGYVNLTGSGFPTGHGTIPAANATVSFSLACGGAVAATATPSTITHILGSTYRVHVLLPGSLTTNTYYASVSGTTSDATAYTSTDCSAVQVTHTSSTLSACVPTSSLGIVAPASGPAPVKAIVPNGAWCCGTTGIQVVQLETGGGPVVPPASIPTADDVNSCAGNPATGEAVCVANNAHVYHLDASNAVTTLSSSSNRTTGFSGGSCENCGVAVNALTNQAVIAMGYNPSPSGSALQTLDLATNTFVAPFAVTNEVSEDISIDPTRGYILSPNESSNYDLIQINSTTGAMTGEFSHGVSPFLTLDSAAEDCSTGIALSVGEFSNTVYLADLTQATFSASTWTAPQVEAGVIGSYSAGLSGVTVAPGSGHLATITGEFGGSSFSVLQLPSTSGTGTPSIVDYAYVPCLTGFSAGYDPHTVSAYTSPNDGKAYTVFANWATGTPGTLYVADMTAILARPREADGHTVIGDSGPGSCLAPGDGIIRSIATH